ncbi:MAG: PqqD family protein [Blastocatellia bacterium]|nr:PqqD family protein [Blastocatellia bacterium]MBL8196869.1 PqqD family protein [Blastocatellia bacterium]MBN8722568.1 PqqD family protein [Acidobacteriota bacterium]
MQEKFFQINSPQVIREFFDDEAVIVNLELGIYYSLDSIGAIVWGLIEQGASNTQIVEKLSQMFKLSTNIEKDIEEFIDLLLKEELIAATDNASLTSFDSINIDNKLTYSKPTLNKYTDMQELLLLDPIHEVDEEGWPNIKNKQAAK